MQDIQPPYDAVLIVSFGGPERAEDVIPFLENVLRGRNVPRERMLEVAEHYYHFGGRSPINDQVRQLIASLRVELDQHGIHLPIYWGNRNWHPMLADTMREMAAAGVRRALAFATSAWSSYSSCRQYRENIEAARQQVGPAAPIVDKIRPFYNHPGFLQPMAENVRSALDRIPANRRPETEILFTAHSIPAAMAAACRYEIQLQEAARLVAELARHPRWRLVYQSRSGPPQVPWLGPDVNDALRELSQAGCRDVLVAPLGFLSDHMEVLYDLDHEAAHTAAELGIGFQRAATVGCHPRFVAMVRELIQERLAPESRRSAIGNFGPLPDFCPSDCCPAPERRPAAGALVGR